MCGIFGILLANASLLPARSLRDATDAAFRLSESRGKEASGVAVRAGGSVRVFKEPASSSRLIRSSEYKRIFDEAGRSSVDHPVVILGHSRLVTNGQSEKNSNNQPVVKDGAVGIHNGIIVNDGELWARHPALRRLYDVDTEVFLSLLQSYRKDGKPLAQAARETYGLIDGSASVAVLFDDSDDVLLATNTGSLYTCISRDGSMLAFASESYSLKQLAGCKALKARFDPGSVKHVPAGEGRVVSLRGMIVKSFSMHGPKPEAVVSVPVRQLEVVETFPAPSTASASHMNGRFKLTEATKAAMMRNWERLYSGEVKVRRCSKCLMPETAPFIRFDESGVCNFCHGYDKRGGELKGEKALEELVTKYRSAAGEPDCIVGFSGGRDSTYGLDYIVNGLKMNPITFTYDWGMVNDLARRNQSRVCSRLGVEQIVVSADIKKKRENIRKNLEAWLKKPDLGMVPLFMAGDKQFYYYFHKIRQQTGVRLFVFCGGHEIEETAFKYGFCGVPHGVDNVMNRLTGISIKNKLKLLSYYAKQYLTNPSYVNSSMLDTFFAYYATYILKDDYLYLYHFIEWDEKRIISGIKEKYDWETAPDTIATWRIDDGTAPFYNYIYLTMAGFTEFDNFRSYQIREGKLTREEAMTLAMEENKPRFDAIEWYAEAVNFDVNRAIGIINAAPKRYRVDA